MENRSPDSPYNAKHEHHAWMDSSIAYVAGGASPVALQKLHNIDALINGYSDVMLCILDDMLILKLIVACVQPPAELCQELG